MLFIVGGKLNLLCAATDLSILNSPHARLNCSLAHSITYSVDQHLPTHSPNRSLISLTHSTSPYHLLAHSYPLLTRPTLTHSVTQSLTHITCALNTYSLTHSLPHSLTHSLTHSLKKWQKHTLCVKLPSIRKTTLCV